MKAFFTLLFFCSLSAVTAQNALLQSFSAQQKDEDVLITWVIGKGNHCSDVEVQHSTDSVNFTVIYTYPGICGNTDEAASYTWLHTSPVADVKNHYRLNLPTNGYSNVITINHHSFESTGYVAAPVPSSGPVTIYFRNSQSIPHTLVIFDMNGREVKRIDGITSEEVAIDRTSLSSGSYFFSLFDDPSKPIMGKIILF